MKRIFALLALTHFCTALAFASPAASLASALRAQAMLGNEVWSQIVRIENTGSTTRYPRALHALVFEVAGILWFYTDSDGTQYFSTHRGHSAEDKNDFARLLREIHPGFQRWTAVEAAIPPETNKPTPLRNGCFVESLANLRQRLIAGGAVLHPRILCYFSRSSGLRGHAVLTFETNAGVEVIDPIWPKSPQVFPLTVAQNAQALGTALDGHAEKALWVPLTDFAATLIAHCTHTKRTNETAMNHNQRNIEPPQTAGAS